MALDLTVHADVKEQVEYSVSRTIRDGETVWCGLFAGSLNAAPRCTALYSSGTELSEDGKLVALVCPSFIARSVQFSAVQPEIWRPSNVEAMRVTSNTGLQ